MENIQKRVKDVVGEDAGRARAIATEAVKSQAYLYPIKGILFFASHKDLWRPLMDKLIPTITTGISVTTAMFIFTYIPQAAALAIVNGPFAAISTILLVLSESSTITNLVTRNFFIQDALVDTFDGTLVEKEQTEIVSEGRQLKSGSDAMGRLGKMLKSPFAKYTPAAMIRYLMYLPLNFIPIVGTVLFVILQGKRFGPAAHARYFQLKKMGASRKEEFVEQRRGAYTSFGIVATLLEMVPFVGIFFAFTNTCGAALWAADLEQQGKTAPNLKAQAESVSKDD